MQQGGATPYPQSTNYGGAPQPGGYPPQQGGYPPQPGGYPPQPGGYPPQPGGYPPQSAPAPYPAATGGLDPQQPPTAPSGYPGQPAPPQAPPGAQGGEPEVMDNPDYKEAEASAPPVEKMDNIAGYDNMSFSGATAPPPSYDEATRGPPPERQAVRDVPVITEDQARSALLEHASQHCCYGKSAAEKMAVCDLQSSSAFHYTLETFGESRQTAWAVEPYVGQPLDTAQNGPAPLPWDIPVNPPEKFKTTEANLEVPHTASVKPCHVCVGNGRVRCGHCHGIGRNLCSSCHGRGRETYFEDGRHKHRNCHWCHGSGRRVCSWCHGHGQVTCKTCQGRGQLKCFIRLTVRWVNHYDDHIVERTALPDKLIRTVSGQTSFEEELPWVWPVSHFSVAEINQASQQLVSRHRAFSSSERLLLQVWPINHFPDQVINRQSKQLVEKHRTAFPSERILLQRHRVRIVPVTQAVSKFKDKDFTYFVYGFENKVYAPDYPQQCCCGCVIL